MAEPQEHADRAAAPRRAIPLREIALPHECPLPVRLEVLGRTPYFHGLGEEAMLRIDSFLLTRSFAAGQPIFRAGEPADALFIVAEGRVKLSQLTPDGTETVTDLLVPGELFGAMGTLGEPRHRQTAVALVGTCALRISQTDFRQVLTEQPAVALRVLDDVAERLSRARADIGGQVTETVPQRVAMALLRLADKLGEDHGPDGILLEVPLSRADLAGLARSTPESVSRTMSRWKKEGIIDSGRRWTALRDLDRLRQEADGL